MLHRHAVRELAPLFWSVLLLAALFGAPAQQARGQDTVSDGLKLHLPFDGNTANARVPGASGKAEGLSYEPGRQEQAAAFDGVKSHVQMPPLDFGDRYSIALWIKPTKTGKTQTLLANRAGADSSTGFAVEVMDNGAIRFANGNGLDKSDVETVRGVVRFDAWNHVAVLVDQQRRTASLYHNGSAKLLDADILDNFVTDAAWRIGSRTDGATPFKGAMDELRIYPGVRVQGLVVHALSRVGGPIDAPAQSSTAEAKLPEITRVSFVRDVRPILEERCVGCHGESKQKGNLRLDSKAFAIKGGDGGPALVPGKPQDSPMLSSVMLPADHPDRMPAKGDALTPLQIATLRRWIESGASWQGGNLMENRKPAATPTVAGGKGPAASEPTPEVAVSGTVSFTPSEDPVAKRIDQIVELHQKKNKITAVPLANDEMFLRRAYLDIIGRIPTVEEARAFLDSDDAGKRHKLVDQLIDSPGYLSHMYNFFAIDLLRIRRDDWDPTHQYAYWLKDAISKNKPYDRMVYELLTAEGNPGDTGAVGYFFRDRETPLVTMSLTSQVFLGTQIGCAQCHNHPFDKWKQMQFYEMASFLGSVGQYRKNEVVEKIPELARSKGYDWPEDKDNDPIFETLYYASYRPNQLLDLPFDYKYDDAKPNSLVTPKFIFDQPRVMVDPAWVAKDKGPRNDKPAGKEEMKPAKTPAKPVKPMNLTERRQMEMAAKGMSEHGDYAGSEYGTQGITNDPKRLAFARWLTSPENPRFAKVMANRLWKRVMGLGLVEPLDDWKDDTRPVDPMLMEYLTQQFVAKKFNVKEFLRALYKTEAYHRHALGDEDISPEKYHFQARLLRRMSAEQVYDSWLTLLASGIDTRQREVGKLEQMLLEYQKGGPRTAERAVDLLIAFQKGEFKPRMMSMEPAMMTMGGNYERGCMTRASEMLYPQRYGSFMHIFGQSTREAPAADSKDAGLQQVLFMLNGDMGFRVLAKGTVLRKQMDEAQTTVQKVNVLFLALLGRYPSAREMSLCREEMDKNRADGLMNVTRALMNSREFLFVQ